MQLTIDIRLNNAEPRRYGENSAERSFNVEIPGTSEDQVNEAKLIQAAQGLAAYEDIIPSLVNELNMKLEAERESNDKTAAPQPPVGADDTINISGEPRIISTEIDTGDADSSGYEGITHAEAELENDPTAKAAFPSNGGAQA